MMNLLTKMESSPKLAKYTGDRYLASILYLASGVYRRELCPNAGACLKTCLIVKAGRGAFDNKVAAARQRKSDWLLRDRAGFVAQLVKEIGLLEKHARKLGKIPAVRLNGGSDLDWSDVYARFPFVQFWEYTKRPDLAMRLKGLPNVHITYSFNERTTPRLMSSLVGAGVNVAVVFSLKKSEPLPISYMRMPVVNGDEHDFRFLDGNGVVVGLRLKSNKRPTDKQVSGGFVQTAA